MKQVCWAFLGLVSLSTGCSPSAGTETSRPAKPEVEDKVKTAASERAQPRYRREWNRKTLVEDYERFGRRNAKWDDSARLALSAFAEARAGKPEEAEGLLPRIIDATKAAMTNGCNDPMIQYLYARFVLPDNQHDAKKHAEAFRQVAEALTGSPRAAVRKYYAALRCSEFANLGTAAAIPEVRQWREESGRFLTQVVKDKATPPGEVYDAWEAYFRSLPKKGQERYRLYLELEPTLFENWPSDAGLFLMKGWVYTEYAWEARGSGVASSVTAKGWRGFEERLAIAEQALTKAWELDPTDARIARRMITVELGQGKGRDRMEQWFERAMALNTNYYDACYAKLYYLEPKWYGSREEMFTFASECLRSEKWGGNVPLIVVDAHESVAKTLDKTAQAEYWKRPEVWDDLHQAFEKFFRLNPKAEGWHHNYACYAYRAEQWAELNRQLALLGEVNYAYFGGKEAFDKMAQAARQHSTNAPASEAAR